MSLFRRYVAGLRPLLVWAEDDEAADITAAVHASMLPPIVVVDISDARFWPARRWLPERDAE